LEKELFLIRVRAKIMIMGKKTVDEIILEMVHKCSGCGKPDKNNCEYESFGIINKEILSDGTIDYFFSYSFDEDNFSMYDKTIGFRGKARINNQNKILELELDASEIGIAARFKPSLIRNYPFS
jgi:hypothetical protein